MFVIPCKFDPSNPIVFECVEAIRKYHPDDKITVVDSNSIDVSYLYDLGVDYAIDAKNINYATNAYHIGYLNSPYEDFYYFVHDSLILQDNISFVEDNDLTTVRYFNSPPTPMGWDDDGNNLYDWAWLQVMNYMNFSIPPVYKGVFGPMFFCKRKIVEQLDSLGLFLIKPKNKFEMSAMERVVGIALQRLGYDPSQVSLQGEMIDFFGNYDQTYVKKVHLLRQ